MENTKNESLIYTELFAYPLSGKTTFLKSILNKDGIEVRFARTDKSITRLIGAVFFIVRNKKVRKFYSILPKKNLPLAYKLKKFLSFISRYKDFNTYTSQNKSVILDEGIAQSVWGLLTTFSYQGKFTEISELVQQSFAILLDGEKFQVVLLPDLSDEEFLRRCKTRNHHHGYIKHRISDLNNQTESKYEYCYKSILSELESLAKIQDKAQFS